MSPVFTPPLKVVNSHRTAKQFQNDHFCAEHIGIHVKSLRQISILSRKIEVLSLTMSLSDILEILVTSRLTAICTGSPAERKKCFSREKGSVKGTVKPLRTLCRVGTVLRLTCCL